MRNRSIDKISSHEDIVIMRVLNVLHAFLLNVDSQSIVLCLLSLAPPVLPKGPFLFHHLLPLIIYGVVD